MKDILILSRDPVFAFATQIILENGGFCARVASDVPSDGSGFDAAIADMQTVKVKSLGCALIFTDYQKTERKFFLLRPFSDSDLLEMCNLVCYGKSTEKSEKLTLDVNKKQVSFGKNSVALTEREFSLLDLLMKVPLRAVSREEIIKTVFGGTATGNADAVYINYLRKKLITLCGKNPIISVRGFGYEFKEL